MSSSSKKDVTRTVLGALTTTFTPDATCFTPHIYTLSSSTTSFIREYGQMCDNGFPTANPNCFPESLDGFEIGDLKTWHPIYTSATICPSGWSSACGFTRSDSNIIASTDAEYKILSLLEVGEIDVACCPRGYSCNYLDEITCQTSLESPDVLIGTVYSTNCNVMTQTISLGGKKPIAFDFMVPVHIVTNTAEASRSTSSFGSEPTEPTAEPAAEPTAGPGDGNGGLSVGAKAAIGVVVPVVSLIIAIAAFFLYRRRKAKKDSAAAAVAAAAAPPPPPAGNEGPEIREYKPPVDPMTGAPLAAAPMGAAGVPVYHNQMMGSPQGHNPYELQGAVSQYQPHYQPQDESKVLPAGEYYKPAPEVQELPSQPAFELPATEVDHQQPAVSPVRNSLPPSSPGNDIPRAFSPVSQHTPSVLTPGSPDTHRLSSTGGIPSSRAD